MIVKPKVVIIGGGPAGLMAAFQLRELADVTIVDHKKALGRKFLVAGDGGFNLTHSEPLESFIQKYDSEFVRSCVKRFTPQDTRDWLSALGINTFIGSSGKIFPVEGTKPVTVLNAILKPLKKAGVTFLTGHRMIDFGEREVNLQSDKEVTALSYDFLILAMGGASWKKTGSDGRWLELLKVKNVPVKTFSASNSGIELAGIQQLSDFEGSVIKNLRLTFGNDSVAGDLVITQYGLEGKPVYAANNWIRNNDFKGLKIDFKPQLSEEQIRDKLSNASNMRKGFQQLHLSDVVYHWLKNSLAKEQFVDARLLAGHIKAFEPEIKGLRPVDEVISVVGGVEMNAIDENGKLRSLNNVWCCGEMLDWDAPTGGYLLQACFSTGFVVSQNVKLKIEK